MKERIKYIDVMKGIAIILVVIGHYISIPSLRATIWSFHLPLFVVVSGYFIKPDSDGLIKKAAKTYLKPYFIVWASLVAVEVIAALVNQRSLIDTIGIRLLSGIVGLGSNATPFRPHYIIKIGAIWYLYALFVSFIYTKLLFKIGNFSLRVMVYVSMMIVFYFWSCHYIIPFNLSCGASFVFWIYLGYFFHKYDSTTLKGISKMLLTIMVLFLWIAIVYLEIEFHPYSICNITYPLYGLELICAICGIVVVAELSKLIELTKVGDILRYIGNRSLWILCVHSFSIEYSLWRFPSIDKFGLYHSITDILIALIINYIYHSYKTKNILKI